jgi:hypothetical protein
VLARDLIATLYAILPIVRTLPEDDRVPYLVEEWVPLQWLSWWYHLIPLPHRAGLALTLLHGQPYNGWIATLCDDLAGVQRLRLARPRGPG